VNNAAIIYNLVRNPSMRLIRIFGTSHGRKHQGPWLCTKAVFPQMKAQKKGKIITISSETFFTGSHGFVHYVASKGGVVA